MEPEPTVTQLTAGAVLGSYRIESILGVGGMGTVCRAPDTKLNRPVAVKLLSDESADAAARRRFQREAQMASSLNHPPTEGSRGSARTLIVSGITTSGMD